MQGLQRVNKAGLNFKSLIVLLNYRLIIGAQYTVPPEAIDPFAAILPQPNCRLTTQSRFSNDSACQNFTPVPPTYVGLPTVGEVAAEPFCKDKVLPCPNVSILSGGTVHELQVMSLSVYETIF